MLADQIPPIAKKRALDAGPVGEAWLAGLEGLRDELAHQWGLSFGDPMHGGSEALVLPATRADGTRAILKAIVPGSETWESEVAVLIAADGKGYARVLEHDAGRRAVLLERLGPTLRSLGYSTETQLRILCRAMTAAWRRPPPGLHLMNGAEKADGLAEFIDQMVAAVGLACEQRTIDLARKYCRRRRAAFDPATAMLCHGDAHADNLLFPGSDPPEFRFIDPDGLFIEPAYDAGLPLREYNEELLGGDAYALGRARAALLAELTGVDLEAAWEWGFTERVTTGLLLVHLGAADGVRGGRATLAIADAWSAATP